VIADRRTDYHTTGGMVHRCPQCRARTPNHLLRYQLQTSDRVSWLGRLVRIQQDS